MVGVSEGVWFFIFVLESSGGSEGVKSQDNAEGYRQSKGKFDFEHASFPFVVRCSLIE